MVENKNFCDVISALQTSFLCAGRQLVQLHHYPHASCSLTGQHVNKEDYFITYRVLQDIHGVDPSAFCMFDFQPLKANHRFKLKFASASLNSLNNVYYTYN